MQYPVWRVGLLALAIGWAGLGCGDDDDDNGNGPTPTEDAGPAPDAAPTGDGGEVPDGGPDPADAGEDPDGGPGPDAGGTNDDGGTGPGPVPGDEQLLNGLSEGQAAALCTDLLNGLETSLMQREEAVCALIAGTIGAQESELLPAQIAACELARSICNPLEELPGCNGRSSETTCTATVGALRGCVGDFQGQWEAAVDGFDGTRPCSELVVADLPELPLDPPPSCDTLEAICPDVLDVAEP